MPAIAPANPPRQQRTPCPHCGKPYRTLLQRSYGIQIEGEVKQSLPLAAQWRCLSCGKSYITHEE